MLTFMNQVNDGLYSLDHDYPICPVVVLDRYQPVVTALPGVGADLTPPSRPLPVPLGGPQMQPGRSGGGKRWLAGYCEYTPSSRPRALTTVPFPR